MINTCKAANLRELLQSSSLEFLMEAHNGLSAKIVEEAGFKGIWASGLSISAALGVRDNNEASWTQVLDVLEFMSDATTIPILLDGDTGYGNFNNARRLVKKLEQREIAGVCIEDKLFPKTNSFINGEAQPLADVEEFCGKIKAMKDVQRDDSFVVVARVEAFIAGWGLDEALKRAEAYRSAGADAILIHSKRTDASEIKAFMDEWANRHPVIIVPTKYYSTPVDYYRQWGVSTVIWANHNVRAAIHSMQQVTERIFRDESLINIEDNVSPVAEIFRLQGAHELEEAEEKYLPTAQKDVNAIILAAAQGEQFGYLTKDIPKTLLKMQGKTILANLLDAFHKVGIKDICVVRGFAKNKITFENIQTIDNDDYASTSELSSLLKAVSMIKQDTVICYGDIIFKNYVLTELLNDNNDITIIVDADYITDENYHEYVMTNISYSKKLFLESVQLTQITADSSVAGIHGEFIGLFKVSKEGGDILRDVLLEMSRKNGFGALRMKDLFNEILKKTPIAVKYIKGSWLDINSIIDLKNAGEF